MNQASEKELIELVKKCSVNYKEPVKETFDYPLRQKFGALHTKDLFYSKGLSPLVIPDKSILIKSEKRNIGKTLLIRCWQETLIINKQIVDDNRLNYGGDFWHQEWTRDLKKYSSRFYCERDFSKHYSKFDNEEFYFNFDHIPKYFFLDDFCYENSYHFDSDKVTHRNFINFMRQLLEYLCNNKSIIVIATTNNNPANILLPKGIDRDKSSLFSRYEEIFTSDGKLNGVSV